MKVYLDNCCYNRPFVEAMGIVEAEYFIAAVRRERFDYTKWQSEHFDKMNLKTFVNNAKTYTQSVEK